MTGLLQSCSWPFPGSRYDLGFAAFSVQLLIRLLYMQKEKVYVQHRMRENGQLLWDMMQDGGCVYVCGDARSMAKEVHRTLREIIMEHGHKDQTEAESVLTRLQTSGRYHQDVWT